MACCTPKTKNTGIVGSDLLPGAFKQFILVPKKASDGTLNSLSLEANAEGKWDADKLFTKVSNVGVGQDNPANVFYPLPISEENLIEKADNTFQTASSGRTRKVGKGDRTVSFEIWDVSPTYLECLESHGCKEYAFYAVDECGNLIYKKGADKAGIPQAYPICIEKDTLDFDYNFVVEGTSGVSIPVNFTFAQIEKVSSVRVIPAEEMVSTYGTILDIEGILDIDCELISNDDVSIEIKLFTKFGSALNPYVDSGLLETAFSLINVTDAGAAVPITLFSESKGIYTLGFAAQDTGDVLQLSITGAAYPGKDYSKVSEKTITVP